MPESPNVRQKSHTHENPEDSTTSLPITNGDVNVSRAKMPATKQKIWMLSVTMLLLYITLGTGAAQLTNLAFSDPNLHFKAPYLFTMIKMVFRAQALTFYLVGNTFIKVLRKRKLNITKTWRRCSSIIEPEGFTWRLVVFRFGPAAIFNLAVQILYTLSMANLSASVATALSAPTVAISYIFSWLFLKQPLLMIKVVSVIVAFAGVALITYDKFMQTISTSSVMGIVCVLLSDLCLSSYQLGFKKAFPKGDFGQVSFAVTGMFLIMCLAYWPVPVALKCTHTENYDIRILPYGILFGAWTCSALAALVYGYGLVLATPFFMSLTELAIMVSNTALDAGVRHIIIPMPQIIGTVLIGFAFLVIILPDEILTINNLLQKLSYLGSAVARKSTATSEILTSAQDAQLAEISADCIPEASVTTAKEDQKHSRSDQTHDESVHQNQKT